MKKKEKRKVEGLNLLENPNMETQVKDKPYKVIFRIIIILVLFSLLVSGYLFKFSIDLFPPYFSSYCTGTFDASNFYGAKDYDLIVFEKYSTKTDVSVGDIVIYSSNLGKGSGKVTKYDHGIIEIKTNDGVKTISSSIAVGKQIKKVPVLGFFVEFIGSYYGIVTFNILLIVYVAYITFSRINYENTNHGKMLYKKFRLNQKEERTRLKLLKKIEKIDDITYVIVSMLENSFEENKLKFLEFDKNDKNLKEKYKYVLKSVHDAYLPNDNLSREEKKHISSVIELMCVCQDMDLDIEYMAIDLLLKTPMVSFDTENFAKEAKMFLESKLDDDDLLNFGSVLYILLYKNKSLRDEYIDDLAHHYFTKTRESSNLDKEILINVASSILKLIK